MRAAHHLVLGVQADAQSRQGSSRSFRSVASMPSRESHGWSSHQCHSPADVKQRLEYFLTLAELCCVRMETENAHLHLSAAGREERLALVEKGGLGADDAFSSLRTGCATRLPLDQTRATRHAEAHRASRKLAAQGAMLLSSLAVRHSR